MFRTITSIARDSYLLAISCTNSNFVISLKLPKNERDQDNLYSSKTDSMCFFLGSDMFICCNIFRI